MRLTLYKIFGGRVKELYYSNGGMIDMDKQTVSPTALTAASAAEMNMKANLLPSMALGRKKATAVNTDANTHGDTQTAPTCATAQMHQYEAGYSHSIALCMNVVEAGMKVTFDEKTQQVMAGGEVYA